MSEVAPPPPDPLLRFRLRTIMALTSGLALAAAVAAPFFRRQSPEAQGNLLFFWSISLLLVGAGVASRLRLVSRVPAFAGPVHFWGKLRWPSQFEARVRPLLVFVFFAISISMMVIESKGVVHRTQMKKDLNWVSCLLNASIIGLTVSQSVTAMSAPIALCERGIPIYGTVTSWRLIRDAVWEPTRCSVLRLHGGTWSIFVEIPIADRQRVELFVRDRIAAANVANER
jgi:hypothetical protein